MQRVVKHRSLGVLSFLAVCVWAVPWVQQNVSLAQHGGLGTELEIGAVATSALDISLAGGTNEFGRVTVLSGNTIDFGPVSFSSPKQVTNGDAFLVGENLRLEAVTNVTLRFNGQTFTRLSITKTRRSNNPFAETYFSVTRRRVQDPETIRTQPLENEVTTVRRSQTLQLRLYFDVTPKHEGRISNRLRITGGML